MKTKFTLILLMVIGSTFIAPCAKAQAVNVQDSLALVDLYNNTNGANWYNNKNWLKGPVATWFGISVENGRVTYINLSINNLIGAIPPEIGNLSSLYNLSLYRNQIMNLPLEIGNLSNLQFLNLSYNQITSLPQELGNLSNLQGLGLSNNQIVSLPPEIGNLSSLSELVLSYNQITSLPPGIDNLSNLFYLDVSSNQIASLPSEIGNLSSLSELLLSYNQIASLPPEIGNLSTLFNLDLSYNQITSLPPELGNLTSLRTLNINYNKLKGKVPSFLADLPLAWLYIAHNSFTFDGMELIAQTFQNAFYDHQKRIPVHLKNNILSTSAGGTLSNNSYHWFKVGEKGYTTIAGDSVFHPSQSGIYYARICNSVATGLILKTDTITYTVAEPISQINISSYENAKQQNNNNKVFIVYPNPTKDVVHVKTNGIASFSLIDQRSRILITANIDSNGTINVSNIAAGIYYLRNNSSGDVKKIVIVK